MNWLCLGTRRVWERSLALALFAVYTLPALAWSQVDSTTSGTSSSTHSSTSEATTTTVTRTEFIYDWRLWAAVGGVLLVILIIAVSRRGSGNQTTVIK